MFWCFASRCGEQQHGGDRDPLRGDVPGLELSGVITSSPDKEGKDAAAFALLDAETGVAAVTDGDPQLTAAIRLLGAVNWLAAQKPGIYDGLDVPMQSTLPPRWERRAGLTSDHADENSAGPGTYSNLPA